MESTLPITISAEANALAEEIGMRSELDQMIERAIEILPNVRAIDVIRYDLVDEPGYPRIVIQVIKNGPRDPEDYWVRKQNWNEWTWEVFRPETYSVITLQILYPDAAHAR
jgi:hypothetical protein